MSNIMIGIIIYLVLSLVLYIAWLFYDYNKGYLIEHVRKQRFVKALCFFWFIVFAITNWEHSVYEWRSGVEKRHKRRKEEEQKREIEKAAPQILSADNLKESWSISENGSYTLNGENLNAKHLREKYAAGSMTSLVKCSKCYHTSVVRLTGIILEYYSDGNKLFATHKVTSLCLYCGNFEAYTETE